MKTFISILVLIFEMGWTLHSEVTNTSLVSNIPSSNLAPPRIEFEETKNQLKTFLVSHPVDLSHHFAASCSYTETQWQGKEFAAWRLSYENQTNGNSRLCHNFIFSSDRPVQWQGYKEVDLERCNEVFIQVGRSAWQFYLYKNGSLRFMKKNDPTGGVTSKLGAIPFEKLLPQLYGKSTLVIPQTNDWNNYIISFAQIKESPGSVRFFQDVDICNELLKLAENKMEASERQKLKPMWEEWKKEFETIKSQHQSLLQLDDPTSKREAVPKISLFEAAAKAQDFLKSQRSDVDSLYLKAILWEDEPEQLKGNAPHWETYWLYRRANQKRVMATVIINDDGSSELK